MLAKLFAIVQYIQLVYNFFWLHSIQPTILYILNFQTVNSIWLLTFAINSNRIHPYSNYSYLFPLLYMNSSFHTCVSSGWPHHSRFCDLYFLHLTCTCQYNLNVYRMCVLSIVHGMHLFTAIIHKRNTMLSGMSCVSSASVYRLQTVVPIQLPFIL